MNLVEIIKKTDALFANPLIVPEIPKWQDMIEAQQRLNLSTVGMTLFDMRCEQAKQMGFNEIDTMQSLITSTMREPYTSYCDVGERYQHEVFNHHTKQYENNWELSDTEYAKCISHKSLLPFVKRRKQEIWKWQWTTITKFKETIPYEVVQRLLKVRDLGFFSYSAILFKTGQREVGQAIAIAYIIEIIRRPNGRTALKVVKAKNTFLPNFNQRFKVNYHRG